MKKNLLFLAMALMAMFVFTSCGKKAAPEIDKSKTPIEQMEQAVTAMESADAKSWSDEDWTKVTDAFGDALVTWQTDIYTTGQSDLDAATKKQGEEGEKVQGLLARVDPAVAAAGKTDPKIFSGLTEKVKKYQEVNAQFTQLIQQAMQGGAAPEEGAEEAAPEEGAEEGAEEEVTE